MDQVKKSDLLEHARNEYFATILAAKVARRLHATQPEKRPDPKAKVTSLALKLITEGRVEYEVPPPAEPEPETVEAAEPPAQEAEAPKEPAAKRKAPAAPATEDAEED